MKKLKYIIVPIVLYLLIVLAMGYALTYAKADSVLNKVKIECNADEILFIDDSKNGKVNKHRCIKLAHHDKLKQALTSQLNDTSKGYDFDVNNIKILGETLNKEIQDRGANSISFAELSAAGNIPVFKDIIRSYYIDLLK